MDYTPIVEKIKYWREYDGFGDEYRKGQDYKILNGIIIIPEGIDSRT